MEMVKKYVPVIMFVLGFMAFVVYFTLFNYYLAYAPSSPNITTGEIYQLNNHGYFFYVTISQGYLLYYLSLAFIVLAFGGAALREHLHIELISDRLIKPTDNHFYKLIHTRMLLIVFVAFIVFILLGYLHFR